MKKHTEKRRRNEEKYTETCAKHTEFGGTKKTINYFEASKFPISLNFFQKDSL